MEIEIAQAQITKECVNAIKKNSKMQSYHEGYALILEELEEAWREIKRGDSMNKKHLTWEIIQTGAMCMRFLIDLLDKVEPKPEDKPM